MNLVKKFVDNPTYFKKGAGFLSKRWNVSKEEIYKAKLEAKSVLHENETATLNNVISEQEDTIAQLISEKVSAEGTELQFSSVKPLSRKEIEDLYKIDNISTRLSTYWNKQLASGKYIVSANVKCLVSDFYSEEQLQMKIASMYKNISPVDIPKPQLVREGYAAFIYIADDHAGMKIDNSLFNNQWNKEIYRERMLKILEKLPMGFEEMFIVRLGDEADGWNSKTTRYDHSLNSLSNKEQFDIFTEVNKEFYDNLFSSGAANRYTVITCNNSNHSGLGLSYIYHKATEFYVQARYNQVQFLPINSFIGTMEWGNHVIGFTHGKDEKLMKNPMPLNLDSKTDLWLYDYYDNLGYSPNTHWISTIKGDIHKFNINEGKSGRYVNVPSISGSSEWSEHNFGNAKAGAVIEVYHKDSPDVMTFRIRFN